MCATPSRSPTGRTSSTSGEILVSGSREEILASELARKFYLGDRVHDSKPPRVDKKLRHRPTIETEVCVQSQRPVLQAGPEAQDEPPALPGRPAHGAAPAGPQDDHRAGAGEEPRPAGRGGPVHDLPGVHARAGTRGSTRRTTSTTPPTPATPRAAGQEASDARSSSSWRGCSPRRRACRTTCCGSSPCSPSPRSGGRSGSFSSAISTTTAFTGSRRTCC